MSKQKIYNKFQYITEAGYELMKRISPGCLLKVEWVDDPDVNAEWGLNILDLEDDENIVMFIKWRPEVFNSKNVISFQCLYQDKIYNCSTIAIIEIL